MEVNFNSSIKLYPSSNGDEDMSEQKLSSSFKTSWNYEEKTFQKITADDFKDNKFQPKLHPKKSTEESKILKRKWKSTLNESQSENRKKNKPLVEFKIVSYNLLSPTLLENNLYLYQNLNKHYLEWRYRRENLLKEIKRVNAHIYCFQEMDQTDYETYFKKKLLKMGLFSVYKKRSNQKYDGCCIAYRIKNFDLENQTYVDYFIPGVKILDRENVGIILLLKTKSKISVSSILHNEPKYLCVATTHLLYNPTRGDSKMAQLQLLLAHIDRVAFKKSELIKNELKNEYYPIILCGDFNFSNESKIYEFLIEAKLQNYKLLNRVNLSGQKFDIKNYIPIEKTLIPERLGITDQSQFKPETESRYLKLLFDKNNENQEVNFDTTFGTDTISHGFNFKSVYPHIDENGIAEITTCVKDFRKSVDFIFFHSESNKNEELKESNKLNLMARLELFNEKECKKLCIPNKNYSSDHFMIAVKLDCKILLKSYRKSDRKVSFHPKKN